MGVEIELHEYLEMIKGLSEEEIKILHRRKAIIIYYDEEGDIDNEKIYSM